MCDGLLLIVPHNQAALENLCRRRRLPYALVDWQGAPDTHDVPMITTTNRKGMLAAIRHLLALGHRRMAYINGSMDVLSARERLQGYRDALIEVGIAFEPALLVDGQWSQQSGYHCSNDLLDQQPDVTAIVAANDDMAFGAMMSIRNRGLYAGQDISVVGFDDVLMAAHVHPGLTTVRQPMHEMGEAAAEMLIGLLRGQTPLNYQRQFSTELIIRASMGRPRVG